MRKNHGYMHTFTIAVLFLFAYCIFASGDVASAEVLSPFLYTINDDNTITITGYTETSSMIIFPEEIDGKTVVSVGLNNPATDSLLTYKLESVVLPDSVTRLEDFAFAYCNNLNTIIGLENLQWVGSNALNGTVIEEAVFGKDLRYLSTQALAFSQVKRIVIPDNVMLYSSSFQETFSLEEIELLKSSEMPQFTVTNDALYNVDMTTLYTVFSGKEKSFRVPETVTKILKYAFCIDSSGALGIQDIFIGENVVEIDQYAVSGYHYQQYAIPVMHVVENSKAYQYAIQNGYAYVIIGSDEDITIQEKIDEIIAECISEDMSEYQKARALHDWLCDHVEYDDSLTNYSAKSALIDGRSTCSGYSEAYAQLLTAVNIENHTVPNYLINHEWNMLKLNGKWVYVDVTWDDVSEGHNYRYFCFNDDVCKMTHGADHFVWGKADTLEYYYDYQNENNYYTYLNLKEIIQDGIDTEIFQFCFESKDGINNGLQSGVLMYMLRNTIWVSGGQEYKAYVRGETSFHVTESSVAENGSSIDVLLYKNMPGMEDLCDDFNISQTNEGICIDGYIGENNIIMIPDTIYDIPVVRIGEFAFDGNKNIEEVYLPESVIYIDGLAFRDCAALEKIVFGSHLKQIGKAAFFNCSRLTNVVLPDSLEMIEESAFSSCINLKSITIPKNIKIIPDLLFYNSGLSNITLDGNITSIGKHAFDNCRISTFSVPEGVVIIDDGAFANNPNLQILEIPSTVTMIGCNIVQSCQNLMDIHIATDPSLFSIVNGCLLEENGTVLNAVIGSVENLYVPNSVETIAAWAASDNVNLKSVSMGNQVKNIGEYAFGNCAALESIIFSDNILELPDGLFINCNNIDNIHLPEHLMKIGAKTFMTKAHFVELPDVSCIPDSAVVLYDVYRAIVPDSVRTIAGSGIEIYKSSWLDNCREIWIPETVTDISDNSIIINGAAGSDILIICVPGSEAERFASKVGFQYAYYPALDEKEIILRTGEMTNLGIRFDGDLSSTNIYYWSDDQSVANVFDGKVWAVGEGETIVHIMVENVSLDLNVIVYSDIVTNLLVSKIPDDVLVISNSAFKNSSVEYVVIPNGCTTIESMAFAECKNLKVVEIPASVLEIAVDAFWGTSEVVIITEPDSVAEQFSINNEIRCIISPGGRERNPAS